MDGLAKLRDEFRRFVKERDWNRFHNPKNLSMSLAAEAAELMEIFMWLSEEQSKQLEQYPEKLQQAKDEIGDVFLNLLHIADVLQIDLIAAAQEKFVKVEQKYPVEQAKAFTKAIDRE
jgi:dCTP diphosphatase